MCQYLRFDACKRASESDGKDMKEEVVFLKKKFVER
jgi:hypothetical protein